VSRLSRLARWWRDRGRDARTAARACLVFTCRGARAGRDAGSRVAVQGLARAWQAGQLTARRIVGIQKAAGLEHKLMVRSARSVAGRPQRRDSDRVWSDGYVKQAAVLVPGLDRYAPEPEPPAAVPPTRPAWPDLGPSGANREAGG
jgi:hypothetical protein